MAPEKVRVLRNQQHAGLMVSRMRGFAASKAPTVTFLDAHCECGPDWLPPLLEAVAADDRHVVAPVIDRISYRTFAYDEYSGAAQAGYFDWDLTFYWGAPRVKPHPDLVEYFPTLDPRMLSRPARMATMRSRPRAIPP